MDEMKKYFTWIKVSERKPKQWNRIYATVVSAIGSKGTRALSVEEGFVDGDYLVIGDYNAMYSITKDCIAWMPMFRPEPYEED